MKYLILFIFLFFQLACMGQTIKKFLLNDYRINDTTITEIIETKKYFDKSETRTYKRTHYYNPKGFIKKMVGLDTEGKLSRRMSYKYDNFDNLIQIKDEKWNHSLGHSVTTTNFHFDSLKLKEIETVGNDGKIVSKSFVENKNQHPTKITTYNRDGSMIGYEIAKYNYDDNQVLIKVYNNQGIKIGKTIDLKLNLSNDSIFKRNGVVKNEFGDITEELKPKCLSCDELITFKYEYKYDDNNNWIRKTSYRIINGEKEKILKIKRRIKY